MILCRKWFISFMMIWPLTWAEDKNVTSKIFGKIRCPYICGSKEVGCFHGRMKGSKLVYVSLSVLLDDCIVSLDCFPFLILCHHLSIGHQMELVHP